MTTIYLHYHYDYDNSRELLCKDAKCYQKRLDDKKKLQEYQDKVDLDLQPSQEYKGLPADNDEDIGF